jgi:hypothetical protein
MVQAGEVAMEVVGERCVMLVGHFRCHWRLTNTWMSFSSYFFMARAKGCCAFPGALAGCCTARYLW